MRKKIFLTLICGVLCKPQLLHAQSFTVENSQVLITYTEPVSGLNHIFSTNGTDLKLRWRVINCNFPTDWLGASGFCDNNLCRYADVLCPSTDPIECTFPAASEAVAIGWSFNLDDVQTYGTYSVTLELTDINDLQSTATQTYEISRPSQKALGKNLDNSFVYPNPAKNNITIQNLIGTNAQTITIFNAVGVKVIDIIAMNGANHVDVSKLPAGLYSVQLRSAKGEILAKENFAHQ